MTTSREQGPRDHDASAFNAILLRLCDASSALGVALVDSEGESVDYAGRLNAYDVRLAGAELRIVLSMAQSTRSAGLPSSNEVLVRGTKRSFAIYALSDGYALVLVLPPYAFRVSRRALCEAADELEREGGLLGLAPREKLRWFRVEVRTASHDDRRPVSVRYDGAWRAVTILGRFQSRDLDAHEIGFMARFASGAELLIVREPLGKWFAGDPRFVERSPA